VGLLAVEVVPSPKSHDQEVGLPVEVSVNVTATPVVGFGGLHVKAA